MSGQLREMIAFKGLVTNPNELATAGHGAMREFTNMRLLRPDLAEKRTSIIRNAINATAINKLFNYDSSMLFHCGAGAGTGLLKKWVPSTSVVTAYSGAIYPTSGRVRSCISNKNLYIAGAIPWRLSGADSTPVYAGGQFAPGFDRLATTFAAGLVIGAGLSVAYRTVFGFTDAKGTTHLGEPSDRMVVTNVNATAVTATIRALIPSTVTTSHFIQFYRSGTVASGTQPDDELKLVYEQQIKALDITNGYLDLADLSTISGAYIYTAPNGGDGILSANRDPPACMEVCDYGAHTWYGNTAQPAEFILSIISVGQTLGIQPGDVLNINDDFVMTAQRNFGQVLLSRVSNVVTATTSDPHGFSTNDVIHVSGVTTTAGSATTFGTGGTAGFTITVTGASTFTYPEVFADLTPGTFTWTVYKLPAAGYYLTETGGTVSYNNQTTALNFISAFNKWTSNTQYWAQYLSAPDEVDQGRILIRTRRASYTTFAVTVAQGSQRGCFSPMLNQHYFAVTATRLGHVVTCATASGTHTLAVGETVTNTSSAAGGVTFAAGTRTITGVTSTTFTYSDAATDPSGADSAVSHSMTITQVPADVSTSDIEVAPNRVYYSKEQKPEATTRLGYVDVGSADAAILAMLPQRGQIWVWKSNGLYRIRGTPTGDSGAGVTVEAMDTSLRVLATESIILFGNRCWGLTDRGVIAISESGIEVMSSAIDNDLRLMVSTVTGATAAAALAGSGVLSVETDCFATAYESQHQYILHVPDTASLDLQSKYGACRYAYVYTLPPPNSSTTGTWGFWDWGSERQVQSPYSTATRGKRCGIVGISDDKLYLGEGLVGKTDNACIFQELKSATISANYEDDSSGVLPNVTLTRTLGTTVTGVTASGTDVTPTVGQRIRLVPSSAAAGGAGFTDLGPFVVLTSVGQTFTFASTGSNVVLAGVYVAVCNPVSAAVTWLLHTADAPGMEKRWDEIEVLFAPSQLSQNAAFTERQVAFDLTLSNEASSASHSIATQGTQTARIWVDRDMARGSRLLVRVTHAVAAEVFQLAGLAVKSEVLSNGNVTR